MIKNFKIFENNIKDINNIVKKIQSVLTPDLLKGRWKQEFENPMAGHCYASTEALYWLLGGPNSDWIPYVLNNKTFSEGLKEGETHWFLKNKLTNDIIDITKKQFYNLNIPYDKGVPNGMMNYPYGGSKRAKEIINRINKISENKLLKENYELSGKYSFLIFLQIISNHNYHFIFNELYNELYNYHLFFSTETIKEVDDFIDIFRYKKSLSATHKILKEIRDNKLSFFFGVKDDLLLRYGFVDLNSKRSYVVGEFNIVGNYFNEILKYNAIQYIKKYIKTSNIENLIFLFKIKKEIKKLFKNKKIIKKEILDNKIIIHYNKDQFSEDDLNMNRPYRILDKWILKKKWSGKVEYSIIDDEDPIKVIIILK